MTDDTLLTVEEVARRLSVHEETIRRWIRNGELVAIELGELLATALPRGS